jgi:hypothetical protein
MWWVIGGAVGIVVLADGVGLLVPAVRTVGGPDFEPASADDASVDRAQQSGTSTGAGGGGAGM